jgi:predicted unusual protein kinase regulating ubiquinone biosynthesis (AarF/ABC1/UbiB family)
MRHDLLSHLRRRRRARLDTPDGHAEMARTVRGALDEAGVTFVKLGQVLSTRPDLLSVEFVDELSKLQDRAAPAAWKQVEQVLTAELDAQVDELFCEVDPARGEHRNEKSRLLVGMGLGAADGRQRSLRRPVQEVAVGFGSAGVGRAASMTPTVDRRAPVSSGTYL